MPVLEQLMLRLMLANILIFDNYNCTQSQHSSLLTKAASFQALSSKLQPSDFTVSYCSKLWHQSLHYCLHLCCSEIMLSSMFCSVCCIAFNYVVCAFSKKIKTIIRF